MKILIVIKRYSGTIGKDAINDDFGREIRLGEQLAKKHSVTILAADHITKESKETELHGMKVVIRPYSMFRTLSFIKEVKKLATENNIVIGTTHQVFALLALMGRKGRPFVYDLRDNYETYDLTNFKGLRRGVLGKALTKRINKYLLKRSSLAVCVSQTLRDYISSQHTIVIPNGVESMFKPLDQKNSRKKHSLPDGPLLTYIGHVSPDRGGPLLLEAFKLVRQKKPKTNLLLSGTVSGVSIDQPGIIFKKFPKRTDVVDGINAADVAVLPQPSNETTQFTFPYKLMEYLACNTNVVATAVGNIPMILKDYPESLCKPDDAVDLAAKIILALDAKKANYNKITSEYTWSKLAAKLEKELSLL